MSQDFKAVSDCLVRDSVLLGFLPGGRFFMRSLTGWGFGEAITGLRIRWGGCFSLSIQGVVSKEMPYGMTFAATKRNMFIV